MTSPESTQVLDTILSKCPPVEREAIAQLYHAQTRRTYVDPYGPHEDVTMYLLCAVNRVLEKHAINDVVVTETVTMSDNGETHKIVTMRRGSPSAQRSPRLVNENNGRRMTF